MKKVFTFLLAFMLIINLISAKEIYVSTNGSDNNLGSFESPFETIQKAVDVATAGDIIYMRGGTYKPTKRIKIDKAGQKDAYISLFGYPGERVIIDGSAMNPASVNEFKQARCIYVNHFGDYWHFKNLEMCNALDNGMKLEGSYNIVENCKFYDNNDTGLQIGMYKDFAIEETNSFPISGEPAFNPNYTYCKYNIVINCDSYNNYDSHSFNGSDDGGDADGFAAKLFPGPGTEFIGCRAWNNSDDNWDLYMVYHPILIKDCWAWKGGYDKNNIARGNGNGFKLGGGGSAGGAAFKQSVGAHVVMNCISFDNYKKGFDQNNAYEGMYLFNNVAWGNEHNYRFPTVFEYGGMYMRNNIGWGATKDNHEFLSEDKVGSQTPNTDFNSWTMLDGCNPYKESAKVKNPVTGKLENVYTQNYAGQFKNLSVDQAKAERQADGSLPDNDFGKLTDKSVFIDKGQNIENFAPVAHSPGGLALPNITVLYNDGKADMGAFETGTATIATLVLTSGKGSQIVYIGTAIQPVVYKWGGAATDVVVKSLPAGLAEVKDMLAKTLTISGTPTIDGVYSIESVGGENTITLTGTISISTVAPAELALISGKAVQEVFVNDPIETMVFTWGGGASDVEYTKLAAGLTADKNNDNKTLTVSGVPTADGSFTVSSVGGMEGSKVVINCNVTSVLRTKILTGDWYNIQDEFENMPSDLKSVISISSGSDATYPTVWDPTYTEKGTVPSGCTQGAVNLERGGDVTWTLPNLVELKSNVHFTGSRTLKIDYTIDGVTKTWTSSALSKQTMLNWDMMDAINLEPTKKPVIIKFYHTSTNGGLRLYDMFVKVYDDGSVNSIETPSSTDKENYDYYVTETALIVYGEIESLQIFNLSGQCVSQSVLSQVVDIHQLPKGVYIAKVLTKEGRIGAFKFAK